MASTGIAFTIIYIIFWIYLAHNFAYWLWKDGKTTNGKRKSVGTGEHAKCVDVDVGNLN